MRAPSPPTLSPRERGLLLSIVLLTSGCAALRRTTTAPLPVKVLNLEVDFPTRDRGELRFTLQLPVDAKPPSSLSWELFLDGIRFAAGVEGQLTVKDGVVEIRSPLVSRHLVWREGEASLDVGLKGEVDVGLAGEWLHFKDRREVQVTGRPVWTTE